MDIDSLIADYIETYRRRYGGDPDAKRVRAGQRGEFWYGCLLVKSKWANEDYQLDVWLGERRIGWIFLPKEKHGSKHWEAVCLTRAEGTFGIDGRTLDEILAWIDRDARSHLTGYYQQVMESEEYRA